MQRDGCRQHFPPLLVEIGERQEEGMHRVYLQRGRFHSDSLLRHVWCHQGLCEPAGLQPPHRAPVPRHRRLRRAPVPRRQQLLQRPGPQDRHSRERLQAGRSPRGPAGRYLSQHRLLRPAGSGGHGLELPDGDLFPSLQLFHGGLCGGGALFARLEDPQQNAQLTTTSTSTSTSTDELAGGVRVRVEVRFRFRFRFDGFGQYRIIISSRTVPYRTMSCAKTTCSVTPACC
mmetsp:Transcript_14659/g.33961  ORF Transcript_14659/g.33961 Transcript_14659/m.33961 type:complete len:230 (-) Transcript_14659:11-700(-)